jgi:hypothetical protein
MRKVEEMGVMHGNFCRTCKRECQKGNPGTSLQLRNLYLSLFNLCFSLSLSSPSLSLSQTAGGLLGCVRYVLWV